MAMGYVSSREMPSGRVVIRGRERKQPMEIVTGDRYLDMLARFVEANVAALLDGTKVLKLNPLGLHYLQARLESLHELERLHTAAPVDYLRAYIADLGDHRALELLRRVLRLLGSVKVVSVLPGCGRDPTPINLQPFENLKSLELRGCDLSTSAARGLLALRPVLEKLICHNSTEALRHVFAERMVEIQSSQVWSRLTSVSCACNSLPVMDQSMQLLPALEVLDLRRNKLTYVSNLEKCSRIKFLDLSFNCIQSVSRLEQVASSLTVLVLRFNALSNTRGIETLYLLQSLDLSHNIISNFHEVERLDGLRGLVSISFEANPITFGHDYRERTFSVFPDAAKLCLDGRYISRLESWRVQKLIQQRSSQTGSFGLYAPALRTSDGKQEVSEEPVAKVKKKTARIAVIADENELPKREQARDYSSTDAACSSSANVLHQLMKRVEMLKKDKSTLWLAETSSLFENDTSTSQEQESSSIVDVRGHKGKQGLSSRRSAKKQRDNADKDVKKRTNSVDIMSSSTVLNRLVDKRASSSSPTSPPQFSREVFRRRQSLEEELLQVRRTDSAGSTDSDTSTSTSDDEENLLETIALESDVSGEPSTSNPLPLLVEGESCFSNPMWIGSASEADKGNDTAADMEDRKPEPAEQVQTNGSVTTSTTPRQQKIRKSRHAWRVVPLDYENDGSDSRRSEDR